MKKIAFVFLAFVGSCFGAAFDLKLSQINDAGTAFAERTVAPSAYYLLGFDSSKHPIQYAPITFDVLLYAADAGSTDAYAITLTPGLGAYTAGGRIRFKANTANTGAATLNVSALGAVTIKKVAGGVTTDLADNDIRAGQIVDVVYDGTNFQMQSLLGNAPSGGGGGSPGGSTTQVQYNSAGAFGGVSGATSDGTNMTFGSGNLRATSPRITTAIAGSNAHSVLDVVDDANAVNQFKIYNSSTGISPTMEATGTDSNVGFIFLPKGTGTYVFKDSAATRSLAYDPQNGTATFLSAASQSFQLRLSGGSSAGASLSFRQTTTEKAYQSMILSANSGVTGTAADDFAIINTTSAKNIVFGPDNGSVGIGVTKSGSDGALYTLGASSNHNLVLIPKGTGQIKIVAPNNAVGLAIAPASGSASMGMYLPSTGTFGQALFYDSTATYRAYYGYIGSTFGAPRQNCLEIGTNGSVDITFRPNETEFSRIFSAGRMAIGSTTDDSTHKLQITGALSVSTFTKTGGLKAGIVGKTSAYTATTSDYTITCNATSAAFTITLPAASTSTGVVLVVKKTDASANAVTIDANASELIDGATTYALSTQWASAMIQCDGSAWYVLSKN